MTVLDEREKEKRREEKKREEKKRKVAILKEKWPFLSPLKWPSRKEKDQLGPLAHNQEAQTDTESQR